MSAIDTDAVGELIRELCASYNVVRIPCDRAYNVRLMGQLLAEGLPIEEFAQSDQNMTRACQRLFDAVAEERVRHGGDACLSEYVLNAAVKTGRQGGFRFTKPDEEAKIDGAIALAMAVDVAEAEWGEAAASGWWSSESCVRGPRWRSAEAHRSPKGEEPAVGTASAARPRAAGSRRTQVLRTSSKKAGGSPLAGPLAPLRQRATARSQGHARIIGKPITPWAGTRRI